MTDMTIEMILSFCVWPHLVVFSIYLRDWVERILEKLKKKEMTGK